MFESGWLKRAPRSAALKRMLYVVSVAALFALGAWFRSRRYFGDPVGLSVDEATWGRRLFIHPVTNMEFRPIGYMALSKLFIDVYSNEAMLRMTSYLPGLASLGIAYDLGRRLFRSRVARLTCLAVVVFHPVLIDMAREFKPYSLEFTVHLGLIWLFLRWREHRSQRWLYALLASAALGFLLAYNIVFALPSLFLILGVTFLREKSYRKLLLTVLAAALALALMGAIYYFIIRGMGTVDEGKDFWGKKYRVFYLPEDTAHPWLEQARWTLERYLNLTTFPNIQRGNWQFPAWISAETAQSLVSADWYLWLSLHLLGLAALMLPGRRVILVSLLVPLLLTMAFNAAGVWPFGIFRTNAFLLAYYLLIPLVGLDVLSVRGGRIGAALAALVCVVILTTNLSIGFDTHERKQFFTAHSELRTVMRRILTLRSRLPEADREQKSELLMDRYSCGAAKFLLDYNETTRAEFGPEFAEEINIRCMNRPEGTRALLRRLRGRAFFVVVADERTKRSHRAQFSHLATILEAETVRGSEDLYLARAR